MSKLQNIKIFLIGMMGSGKTSVGKKLSKLLNLELIDIDNEIERITNLSIKEIFSSYGEKKFRQMERSYFIEINKTSTNCIFATSGGIILNKDCRDLLKNERLTFLLESSADVLLERLKKVSSRPLLSDKKDPYKVICDIWERRKELYYESSKYIVPTDSISESDIAESIKLTVYENN